MPEQDPFEYLSQESDDPFSYLSHQPAESDPFDYLTQAVPSAVEQGASISAAPSGTGLSGTLAQASESGLRSLPAFVSMIGGGLGKAALGAGERLLDITPEPVQRVADVALAPLRAASGMARQYGQETLEEESRRQYNLAQQAEEAGLGPVGTAILRGIGYAPDAALQLASGGLGLLGRGLLVAGSKPVMREAAERVAAARIAEQAAVEAGEKQGRRALSVLDETAAELAPYSAEELSALRSGTVLGSRPLSPEELAEAASSQEGLYRLMKGGGSSALNPPGKAARLETEAVEAGRPVASWLSPENSEAIAPAIRDQLRDRVAQRAIDEMEPLSDVGRARVGKLRGRHRAGPVTRLARDSAARTGVLTEYAGPEINQLTFENISVQGRHRHLGMRSSHTDYFGDALEAATGFGRNTRKVRRWLDETVEMPTLNQGSVPVTRNEVAKLLAMVKDPDNRRVILRDGLWIRRLDPEEPVKITESALRSLERDLGQSGEGRLAQAAVDRMPEIGGQVNQATRRVLGEEYAVRPQYFPRVRHGAGDEKALSTFDEVRRRYIDSLGILKERTGGTQPVVLDNLTDAFFKHADDSSRFAAYLEPYTLFKEIAGRPDVAERLKATLGEDGFNRILDGVELQTVPLRPGTTGDSKMRALMRNTGAGILGARLGPLFLNPSGLAVSAAYMDNPLNMARALASPGRWSEINEIASRFSPAWRDRYEHNFVHHSTSGLLGENMSRFGPRSLAEKSLVPLESSDKFGATIRWGAAEREIAEKMPHLTPGSDEFYEQVAREWERMMYRGENTAHGFELSGALAFGRRNPVFGSFVMFQSSTSKIYSLLPRAAAQIKRGDYTGAAQSLASFVASQAYSAWARTAVGWLRGQRRGQDVFLSDDEARKKYLKTVAQEAAGLPPFIGNQLRRVASSAVGEGSFGFPTSTLEGMLERGGRAALDMVMAARAAINDDRVESGEQEWRVNMERGLKDLASTVATARGVPVEGLRRDLPALVKKAYDLIKGEDPLAAEAILDAETGRSPGDVTKAGNKLWAAVQHGDSELFRKALEEKKSAGGSMNQSAILNTVNNRGEFKKAAKYEPDLFAGVERNEDRLNASPELLQAMDDILEQRRLALETATELLRENEDLIEGFAGDGSDYLDSLRGEPRARLFDRPPSR